MTLILVTGTSGSRFDEIGNLLSDCFRDRVTLGEINNGKFSKWFDNLLSGNLEDEDVKEQHETSGVGQSSTGFDFNRKDVVEVFTDFRVAEHLEKILHIFPDVIVILSYSSSFEELVSVGFDDKNLESTLDHWLKTIQLIRLFYSKHRNNSLLIDSCESLSDFNRVLNLLNEKFDLSAEIKREREAYSDLCISTYLENNLLAKYSSYKKVYDELGNMSDLHPAHNECQTDTLFKVVEDYRCFRNNQIKLDACSRKHSDLSKRYDFLHNKYLQVESCLKDTYQSMTEVANDNASHGLIMSMEKPVNGFNWYAYEENDGVISRWMGPGNKSIAIINLNTRDDYILVIDVIGYVSKAQLDSAVIEINGVGVQYEYVRVKKHHYLTVSLNKQQFENNVEIAITVDNMLSPASLTPESDDYRLLGLCLESIFAIPSSPVLGMRLGGKKNLGVKAKINMAKHNLSIDRFPLAYFDGIAYLRKYQDVAELVRVGKYPSALHHYLTEGIIRGNELPLSIYNYPGFGDVFDVVSAPVTTDVDI